MSDSNRVLVSIYEEDNFGELNGSNPTMQDLRYTSESLQANTASVQSAEIRADRAVADIIRTGLSTSGDLNIEWSYGSYEQLMQRGLQAASAFGSETAVITGDTNVSVTDTDTFTLGVGSWTNTPTVGEWIEVRGFTETGNNGYFKVTAATSTTIDVEGTPLTVEASGDSITIGEAASITNGTTFKSFGIEKHFQDLTNTFMLLKGQAVDTWNLSIGADQILTGSFGFIGKDETRNTATAGDGSNTAASTTSVMNGVDNVLQAKLGGTQFDIIAATMQLQNNLRSRLQVGTLGAISVGSGTGVITGTLQAYFDDGNKARVDLYHQFTETSLSFVTEDAAGNAYIFDYPAIKITALPTVVSGQNADVILDIQWSAKLDSSESIQMRVSKFAA